MAITKAARCSIIVMVGGDDFGWVPTDTQITAKYAIIASLRALASLPPASRLWLHVNTLVSNKTPSRVGTRWLVVHGNAKSQLHNDLLSGFACGYNSTAFKTLTMPVCLINKLRSFEVALYWLCLNNEATYPTYQQPISQSIYYRASKNWLDSWPIKPAARRNN